MNILAIAMWVFLTLSSATVHHVSSFDGSTALSDDLYHRILVKMMLSLRLYKTRAANVSPVVHSILN